MKHIQNEAGVSLMQIVVASAAVALIAWLTADFMLTKDRAARRTIEKTRYYQLGQQTSEEMGDPALVPNNMGIRSDQLYP